jgi:hypothetical protein
VNNKWLAIALVSVSLAAGAGCKQGIGDRCQVDSDCASGVCSQSVPKVCVGSQTMTDQIDSMLPTDAPPDSPVDAATD